MVGGRGGRGRGKVVANAAMRTRGGMKITPSTSNQPRKTTTQKRLPEQYQVTPVNPEAPESSIPPISHQVTPPVPVCQPRPAPGVKNYPPPLILFNNSGGQHSVAPSSSSQAPGSGLPQPQPSAAPRTAPTSSQPRRPATSQPEPQPQPSGSPLTGQPASSQPRRAAVSQPLEQASPQARVSPSNPRPSTPHSSQAQNDIEEEDEEDYEEVELDEDADKEPTLPEDVLAALHRLLTQPGRENFTTVLSPLKEPGTTW